LDAALSTMFMASEDCHWIESLLPFVLNQAIADAGLDFDDDLYSDLLDGAYGHIHDPTRRDLPILDFESQVGSLVRILVQQNEPGGESRKTSGGASKKMDAMAVLSALAAIAVTFLSL
jgi:hypothetical protein